MLTGAILLSIVNPAKEAGLKFFYLLTGRMKNDW
jgi:hypothetical protein